MLILCSPEVCRRVMRFGGLLAAMTCWATHAQGLLPIDAPPAAPLAYRSALEGYRPYAEAPVQPWQDTNERVGRAGGWRAYAREARDAQAVEAARPQPSPNAPPISPLAPAAGRALQ